jgi:hypothetical protein
MTIEQDMCCKQIDDLLNLPQQSWLLGAGVSKDAGIPLMFPLTDRVEKMLTGEQQADFKSIRSELTEKSHVEHVLSHLGDLIALASRTKGKKAKVGAAERTAKQLAELHAAVQKCIRDTMCWGYAPADGSAPEQVGTRDLPIVTVDTHCSFVQSLFHVRRANLERRPPVALFTTNYDTLIEDALALSRVRAIDGFSGGAMGFWEPDHTGDGFEQPFSGQGSSQAKVYKLHGSTDWFASNEDLVVRRRQGAGYPPDDPSRLLIYPQATKYQVTQKDPFARLFAAFRSALNDEKPGILIVCGYSFGDDHVNEEIALALRRRGSQLTVLAFVKQPDGDLPPPAEGLPDTLARWLQASEPWKERIIVAGSRGVYHGSVVNKYLASTDAPHPWWSFSGVTKLLRSGPEART